MASLGRFYVLLAGGSPDMEIDERDGIFQCVAPAVPGRSVLNAVVYADADALAAAYDRLDAGYEGAGIEAWTAWVPDIDEATATLLSDRGHVLDADPEAMIADLDGVERPPEPPGFARESSMATIGRINDSAYVLNGDFERALAGHSGEGFHVYVAGDGPDACVVFSDEADDAAVWLVATEPAARGAAWRRR